MEKKEKINIKLTVDGKNIPLNEFVKSFFINTINGMLSSLKGADAKKNIKIDINL